MKWKWKTKILRESTIVKTLFAVGLLVLLPGVIDNAAILVQYKILRQYKYLLYQMQPD